MKRVRKHSGTAAWLLAWGASTALVGCNTITGINDLEVVETQDESSSDDDEEDERDDTAQADTAEEAGASESSDDDPTLDEPTSDEISDEVAIDEVVDDATDEVGPDEMVADDTTLDGAVALPDDSAPVDDTAPADDSVLVDDTVPPDDSAPLDDSVPPDDTVVDPGMDSGVPDASVPVLTCPSEQMACNDACVDITSDEAHCGGCNLPCGAGQECVDANCTHLIACGGEPCDVLSNLCCVDDQGATCTSGTNCGSAVPVSCSAADDCPGQICCGVRDITSGVLQRVGCEDQCNGPRADKLCRQGISGECQVNENCEASELAGIAMCQ